MLQSISRTLVNFDSFSDVSVKFMDRGHLVQRRNNQNGFQ